ncbi:YfcE family phosphodiesterase [Clostridium sp. ZBS15]|uniref:metallophosphoesterase family protein n=1 Tax=Clostridium sp. ZBS15 TaxID=2949969 RepID=UPI0020793DDB|nr:YfcE family phosphodiesterase [Clostridium sp. ZBS15]
MKFAVIGDIHGNKYALEKALIDINNKNVDFIISTGDLVGYMPYPNEVIKLIRKNNVIVVKGNHDKYISECNKISTEIINKMADLEIQKSASLAFTNWIISDENRDYLKALMNKLCIEHEGIKIVVVHGSPFLIDEYVYGNDNCLANIGKLVNEDVIICGHTHIPYFKKINNKYFINSGSIGKPKHGESLGTYVIVDILNGSVKCTIEKVEYDVELMIKDIECNRMISNDLISMLRKGI